MRTNKDNSESAFPQVGPLNCEDLLRRDYGMSYRQWLIGQALAGITGHCCAEGHPVPDVAMTAIQYADAVIAELKKEQTP